MTTLLSLPSEIIIDILIAAPTTRTLLRLSCVSRRIRAIWQEHSQHIIVSNYKTKIPHIEEAISLTLLEAQCGEVPCLGEQLKLHLYLPRVLRNAGLATSVCDAANRDNTLEKIEWETEDKYSELLRAYYLICHTLLAYDHPELRPAVCSVLSGCTSKMHAGNTWLRFFLLASASVKLGFSLGLLELNTDGRRGPGEDTDYPPYPLR